jgi:substrate import-associated zinc metallohydrolase lipoprotein
MKKNIYYLLVLAIVLLFSCNNDPIDENNSIFDTTPPDRTVFDQWLLDTYTFPYNIEFAYKFDDVQSNMSYNLATAEIEKSQVMAQLVDFMWIQSYDEITGSKIFMKNNTPRVIFLVGSWAYEDNGSYIAGTAEGGVKVTLYGINTIKLPLDAKGVAAIKDNQFHVMHHEFCHILNQKVTYDPDFKTISDSAYIGDNWTSSSDNSLGKARPRGFVSPYARKNDIEDFAELYAHYVTRDSTWWADMLVSAGAKPILESGKPTGKLTLEGGALIINQKMAILRAYFQDRWNIDIDEMRKIVLRRGDEVVNMEFLTF